MLALSFSAFDLIADIIYQALPATRPPERAASPSLREVSPTILTFHKVSTVLRLVMKHGAVDLKNLAPLM